MRAPHCLVVAKAPVPGLAKTRLGAEIGMEAAADVAAGALLDTLDAALDAFPSRRCHLALAGDLALAARRHEIVERLTRWTVFDQVGETFGERLAHAHQQVRRRARSPVVQVGMDTPQVTGGLLREVVHGLRHQDAVLGPAVDGGWWVLALRDAADATVLADVPTSTPETGDRTLAALRSRGLRVGLVATLRDVDTAADARAVAAAAAPGSRFADAWAVAGARELQS